MILWISARDIDLLESGPKPVSPRVITQQDISRAAVELLGPPNSSSEGFDPDAFFQNCLAEGAEGPTLFVLDNFETLQSPADVFKWIDTYIRPPNKVLITTRSRDFNGDYAIKIGGMTDELCWFSVKMTASLDVNATPGGRMSPIAPGIVPECSGASRVKRATRAGFAALDAPSALWYSLLVGERERSGAPGIRVFMRAPCYYAALAATLVPAPVSGPAPTRSLGPCQP